MADVTWLRRTKGVRRMEANYARVRPDLDAAAVRRLSRAGMRSYMRYFREAFTLQGVTPDSYGRACAWRATTSTCGPWSTAGERSRSRWATSATGTWPAPTAPSTSRTCSPSPNGSSPTSCSRSSSGSASSLGINVLALGNGDVLGALVRGAKEGSKLIPLLSDRDLTSTGIEVDLAGHRARVAAGPALLGLEAGVPVHAVGITYERLHGARRRAAGTPWGIVITFYPPLPVPDAGLPRDERARLLTQGWVDQLTETIVEHTQDWHMLQRVFVADLGPARQNAARRARATG